MKKLIALLLVLIMAVGMVACDTGDTTPTTVPNQDPTVNEDPSIGEDIGNDNFDSNAIYAKTAKMTTDGVFASSGVITAECLYCGETVEWTPLNSSSDRLLTYTNEAAKKRHHYLKEDITRTIERLALSLSLTTTKTTPEQSQAGEYRPACFLGILR